MSLATAAQAAPAPTATVNIHATCVAIGNVGVLLCGPSGSGKSDLALRLIAGGAELVADDRVDLRRKGDCLIATAPQALTGLIEAVGIGPLKIRNRTETTVDMIVDLVSHEDIERLPDPAHKTILGIELPCLAMDPFGAATSAKLRLLAGGAHIVTDAQPK